MYYLTKGLSLNFAIRLLAVMALAVIPTILLTSHSYAQEPNMLQKVQDLKIPSSTNKITVYYSPGYKKKAIESRSIIEDAMRFYEKKLRIKVELSLAVLTRVHSDQVEKGVLYGIPHVSPAPHVAFLPATSDGNITTDVLGVKNGLSPTILNEISLSGFTYEGAAVRFVDLIGLHELGHTYTLAYGIRPVNNWFGEFMATYFAYAYLSQTHPKWAKLYDLMHEITYRAVPPQYTSLEDFERLYFQVGPKNYGWYQATFLEKAKQIYQVKGLSFLVDVQKAFPVDEKPTVNLTETLHRLEKIARGFVDWAEKLKNRR